jgi:hypothetical protein
MCCLSASLTAHGLHSLITQICVIKSIPRQLAAREFAAPKGEEKTMPLLQILRPTLPDPDRRLHDAHAEHGLAAVARHFLQPLTHDIGISVSDFTLALAVQNLAWGFLQPLAGAMTVRYGFRPIMMVGALILHRGPCADGNRAGASQRHDRRRAC